MKVEPLASVKAHLSALLDEVSRTHEQYTVTRNGQPIAVILAAEDYESLMETIALLSDQEAMDRLAEPSGHWPLVSSPPVGRWPPSWPVGGNRRCERSL
jgi:prevent-host-death family protein